LIFQLKVRKQVHGDSELRADDNSWIQECRRNKRCKELDNETLCTLSPSLNIVRAIELRIKRQAPQMHEKQKNMQDISR
jgi:hypothetical protein